MILGRDAIIKAIVDGLIVFSSCPDYKEDPKGFKAWVKERVQPASVDLPLGDNLWVIPEMEHNAGTPAAKYMARPPVPNDHRHPANERFKLKKFSELKEGQAIIGPHGFVLAHTEDYVSVGPFAAQVSTRSTVMRNGLDVCQAAGWVDPGYNSRITLEITNSLSRGNIIRSGVAYAQIVFMDVKWDKETLYGGSYNVIQSEWQPTNMLPKAL